MGNALVVFEGKEVRRTWFNEEWWFVAGVAREELEKRSEEKVVSNENYLDLKKKKEIENNK